MILNYVADNPYSSNSAIQKGTGLSNAAVARGLTHLKKEGICTESQNDIVGKGSVRFAHSWIVCPSFKRDVHKMTVPVNVCGVQCEVTASQFKVFRDKARDLAEENRRRL